MFFSFWMTTLLFDITENFANQNELDLLINADGSASSCFVFCPLILNIFSMDQVPIPNFGVNMPFMVFIYVFAKFGSFGYISLVTLESN